MVCQRTCSFLILTSSQLVLVLISSTRQSLWFACAEAHQIRMLAYHCSRRMPSSCLRHHQEHLRRHTPLLLILLERLRRIRRSYCSLIVFTLSFSSAAPCTFLHYDSDFYSQFSKCILTSLKYLVCMPLEFCPRQSYLQQILHRVRSRRGRSACAMRQDANLHIERQRWEFAYLLWSS